MYAHVFVELAAIIVRFATECASVVTFLAVYNVMYAQLSCGAVRLTTLCTAVRTVVCMLHVMICKVNINMHDCA